MTVRPPNPHAHFKMSAGQKLDGESAPEVRYSSFILDPDTNSYPDR